MSLMRGSLFFSIVTILGWNADSNLQNLFAGATQLPTCTFLFGIIYFDCQRSLPASNFSTDSLLSHAFADASLRKYASQKAVVMALIAGW